MYVYTLLSNLTQSISIFVLSTCAYSPCRHVPLLYFSRDKHFESFNVKCVHHAITNVFHLNKNWFFSFLCVYIYIIYTYTHSHTHNFFTGWIHYNWVLMSKFCVQDQIMDANFRRCMSRKCDVIIVSSSSAYDEGGAVAHTLQEQPVVTLSQGGGWQES